MDPNLLWFPLMGVIAGFLAGLLGIGGGIVLVAALVFLLPHFQVPDSAITHVALASSLASIVITGASSAYAHHRRGAVLIKSFGWLAPGLLIGASLGGVLAAEMSSTVLQWGVAGFCIIVAVRMGVVTNSELAGIKHQAPKGWLLSIWGLSIGAISSLVGIGGGSMTVPLLTRLGVPTVRAVGTSSACGVAIALSAALTFAGLPTPTQMPEYSWGYVYLPAAIGIGVAAVFSASWGVRLAHHLHGDTLKKVFALVLFFIGLTLAITSWV